MTQIPFRGSVHSCQGIETEKVQGQFVEMHGQDTLLVRDCFDQRTIAVPMVIIQRCLNDRTVRDYVRAKSANEGEEYRVDVNG
jgi:hypothetical protein